MHSSLFISFYKTALSNKALNKSALKFLILLIFIILFIIPSNSATREITTWNIIYICDAPTATWVNFNDCN